MLIGSWLWHKAGHLQQAALFSSADGKEAGGCDLAQPHVPLFTGRGTRVRRGTALLHQTVGPLQGRGSCSFYTLSI